MAINSKQVGELFIDGSVSTSDVNEIVVASSKTGKVVVKAYGDFAGALIQLQDQIKLEVADVTSPKETLAEGGSYSAKFGKQIYIGVGSNLFIDCTLIDAGTTIYIKVHEVD